MVATELGFFISDALRAGTVNLYDGLHLADLEMALLRRGYAQPAWPRSDRTRELGIRHILSIIMLCLTARYFREPALAQKHKQWLAEAESRLTDDRGHYHKRAAGLLAEGRDAELYAMLKTIRSGKQPFDDGPYHSDVFPFDYLSPETKLLEGASSDSKVLSPEIIDLIAEIGVDHGL